jgi:copper(I)-binding protein
MIGMASALWPLIAWGQISLENPWTRTTPPNAKVAAGYLTVKNDGATDKLLGASSPAAQRVELHITLRDGDILRMREVKELGIPAGSSLVLEPNGAHLMLTGLKRPFKTGEKVPVTLRFAKAGEVKIELAVRAPPKPKAPADHKHRH